MNLTAALKAMELKGKVLGLLSGRAPSSLKQSISLSKVSTEELHQLLKEIEKETEAPLDPS